MAVFDPMQSLARDLTTGRIARRDFIKRAAALGFSATAIAGALAACGAADVPAVATTVASVAPTAAAVATAVASTAPTAAATRAAGGASTATTAGAATATRASGTPASGAGGVPLAAIPASPSKRGGGGTLKLLYWQAPTVLNTHLAQGTKDQDASRLVYEPLATIDGDGKFIPVLASEIPSPTNGGLSADQSVVTWKLKQGVKWSDGQPFTAKDVVFTYNYVMDDKTGAVTTGDYLTIAKIEAPDDYTVKITFKDPQSGWYIPFVGGYRGVILPEHVFSAGKGEAAKNFPANLQPIGTGPYKVTPGGFKPGDSVTYEINTNYRDANAPSFDAVQWKGGGDAVSAARAVIQTGDYDYGWNLQVEAATLTQLQQGSSTKGTVFTILSPNSERIVINFTDPNKEVDGERSSLKAPHPFLTDKAVRQAMALACDRKTVVDVGYGQGGAIADNFLYSPSALSSPNNKSEFNIDKANQILDAAGWVKSGAYRSKNGVQLSLVYYTTVNTVRQKTQQIIKDAWEKIGIKTELKSADAAVFFASDLGNTDTAAKCYVDVEMFTNGNSTPEPFAYMEDLSTAKASQKSNQWSGGNYGRWSNKDYDAVIDQLKKELDPTKRTALFIKANDILIQDYAVIPLVYRTQVSSKAKNLEIGPGTAWDDETWNIANWVKK